MFRKIGTWIRSNREWHRRHREAWAASPPDAFQRHCEHELTAALRPLGISFAERREEHDGCEVAITARLHGASLGSRQVFVQIYAGGASLNGQDVDLRFEELDALTPDDLSTAFVASVVAEVGSMSAP
jgi:hypothetical protein